MVCLILDTETISFEIYQCFSKLEKAMKKTQKNEKNIAKLKDLVIQSSQEQIQKKLKEFFA